MTIALHLPTRTLGGRRAAAPRRLPRSAAIAAIGAGGAALALTLYAELPRSAPPSVGMPPVPALHDAANAVPAFALEVDWSRVEAAENPSPLAVAAYGP